MFRFCCAASMARKLVFAPPPPSDDKSKPASAGKSMKPADEVVEGEAEEEAGVVAVAGCVDVRVRLCGMSGL